ncbi:trypsin-like serine protease [Cellulomonas sp. CW35]|uniref:trypsin-like serine protease n=1 Tax=Cellulomonas sp. CW35 TaxID=3458249 RepID=UPI004033DAE5
MGYEKQARRPSVRYGCSAAFGWVEQGNDYLVTAAHCYKNPNGTCGNVARVNSDKSITKIGTVTWSSGDATGTKSGLAGDIALVRLSSARTSGMLYTGTYNTTTKKKVLGRTYLTQGWTGSNLRTSGASGFAGNGSGELNPNWVSLVNQTLSYGGMRFTKISVAEHSSTCTKDGDSGGAFYLNVSGGVHAVGVISGSNGGGALTTNCRNYYTPISFVAANFGGSIKTS